MSRQSFDVNYKESLILKHALQISIEYKKMEVRDKKEIDEDYRLLQRVNKFTEGYKNYIEGGPKYWDNGIY